MSFPASSLVTSVYAEETSWGEQGTCLDGLSAPLLVSSMSLKGLLLMRGQNDPKLPS